MSPRQVSFRPLVVILAVAVGSNFLKAQDSPTQDVYLPDLGIVIDAKSDTTNAANLVMQKQASSLAYIESTKELREMLGAISGKIEGLETTMDDDMAAISLENRRLRSLISRMQDDRDRAKSAAEIQPSAQLMPSSSAEKSMGSVSPREIEVNAPDVLAAYLAGNYELVTSLCTKLDDTALTPSLAVQVAYWCADANFRSGRFDESLLALGAFGETPHALNDDAIILKGMIYLKLGKGDMARTEFKKIVSQHPTSDYFRLAEMTLKEIHEL